MIGRLHYKIEEMKAQRRYYLLLTTAWLIYLAFSKQIFEKVFQTSTIIIDELFHIPQGLHYCYGNYSYWNPKITTLPGLYLVSSIFLGSYFSCNIYNFRFINFVASSVNLLLFASILRFIYGNSTESQFKIVLQALNLAILPPLYFFSFVYYTDTLSLMFLLLYSRMCLLNRNRFYIFVLGILSVLMRQTNILWVAMVLGHKVLDILIRTSCVRSNNYLFISAVSKQSGITEYIDKSKLKRQYSISDLYIALKYHSSTYFSTLFRLLTMQDLFLITVHLFLIVLFLIFVYVNGSIVVGDKEAHKATLNIPQIFYFLLFYGIFGLPYVVFRLRDTLSLMFKNKINMILLAVLIGAAVHFNTAVHPYLLADNRHYTFYIWNRWFGKYDYAIYATIPAYVFLLFSLYDNLRGQNCISFLLPYTISLVLGLSLQKMIEVRYFLVPYIIARMRFVRPLSWVVTFEFVWYLILNVATFMMFFTKEIYWREFDYPQRIIW